MRMSRRRKKEGKGKEREREKEREKEGEKRERYRDSARKIEKIYIAPLSRTHLITVDSRGLFP